MLRDHQPARADITPPPSPRPDAVHLRARRNPRLIALGVLAIVLGALGAAALYSLNTDLTDVVVVTRDVVRGDIIEATDLAVVGMPGSLQMDMSPAHTLEAMVGQRALSDLPAGSFPLTRHVGEEPVPQGESLIGIRLTAGRLPSAPLPPGTRVQLVSLAEDDNTVVDALMASSPVLLGDGSGHLLDVTVDDDMAAEIATLAATDQLVLIAVGEN
ncbi:MAG: SAF domain-containing protein [Arachnia sp.]